MDRALKRVALAILVMFLLLLINVNYLQAFEAPSLASEPQNDRAAAASSQYIRGNITTADGQVLASTKTLPASSAYKYQRYYTNGPVYAPVTGNDTLYSSSGVEHAENSLLSGQGDQLAFRNFIDMITNKPQKGATIQLTVNSKAQQAAYAGLQSALQGHTGKFGGVVAIEPSTGKILAMASWPSYDPNETATHDTKALDKLVGAGGSLIRESPSPLTNAAAQSLLPPGSTFKIITSSAYFTKNPNSTTTTQVPAAPTLSFNDTSSILHNDQNEQCQPGSNQAQILYAFAKSCNTAFGYLGEVLGGSTLQSMAQKYGFNQTLTIPGITPSTSGYVLSNGNSSTAFSAIGQFSDTATALQEAMLSATVANNGTLMKPYLVQQAIASDLSVVQSTQPSVLSQPVTPQIAGNLQQMMTAVMQSPEGTGTPSGNSGILGFTMAGKTGTASGINGATPNAVFTGYAPAGSGQTPKIAVGVMIQSGGYGASAALPIAVKVIQAYLASVGK